MRCRTLFRFTAVIALAVPGASICYAQTPSVAPAKPPVAPVRPVTDDYFGTKVVDNYRYMENLNDPEVQSWFKNQDAYTRAALASIPGHDKLLARMRELRMSAPARVTDVQRLPGDLYFYQELLAGQQIPKLYMRQGLKGEERLLVDPDKVEVAPSNRRKGKNAFAHVDISPDGKYVAVGITPGGSEDDTEIHVFEVATGHETGDVIFRTPIDRLGGNPQWLADNRSFVYGRLQDLPRDARRRNWSKSAARTCTFWERTRKRTRPCLATAWCGPLT